MVSTTAGTWEEYECLPDDVPAEYVDGKVLVNPRPTRIHQKVTHRLARMLEDSCELAGAEVVVEWAWKPSDDEFSPDVLVVPPTDEDVRFTGTPLLAVEVLSTNRAHDLVTKAFKYAEAGLPRYWVVDPSDQTVTEFELAKDAFVERRVVSGADEVRLDFGAGTLVFHPQDLFG